MDKPHQESSNVHRCARPRSSPYADTPPGPRQWSGPTRTTGRDMRQEFHSDLLEVGRLLVSMAEASRTAMRNASIALLDAELSAGESVVARDEEIDALYRQIEEKVHNSFARQAPVAGDLRLLLTALH